MKHKIVYFLLFSTFKTIVDFCEITKSFCDKGWELHLFMATTPSIYKTVRNDTGLARGRNTFSMIHDFLAVIGQVYSTRNYFPNIKPVLSPIRELLASSIVIVELYYLYGYTEIWDTTVVQRHHNYEGYWWLSSLGRFHINFQSYESQSSGRRFHGRLCWKPLNPICKLYGVFCNGYFTFNIWASFKGNSII